MSIQDLSQRDENALVTFYVPLWKRSGLHQDLFDDYWRDVHGPVCARIPGQYQYWQFHVAHNLGGMFPGIEGVGTFSSEEEQFDGIAELTFRNVEDRAIWFEAAGILMADEHNIFRIGIGYTTSPGNSKTWVDRIEDPAPNGRTGLVRMHVQVRQKAGTTREEFRSYLTEIFAPNVTKSSHILKLRTHLFEKPDLSRPDAAGVSHSEPESLLYQAAFEMAFLNHLEMEYFFASTEFGDATSGINKVVSQLNSYPEKDPYCFVYDGKMTTAGQRGSRTAYLITDTGAINQTQEYVLDLICGKGVR